LRYNLSIEWLTTSKFLREVNTNLMLILTNATLKAALMRTALAIERLANNFSTEELTLFELLHVKRNLIYLKDIFLLNKS